MSNEKQARHTQSCDAVADGMPQCTVVVVGSDSSNVPSQSKKEQAKPILYIDRI